MSETLKDTLMKIELASKSYDKYENGMETFEWNDLYELNCYIEDLQQRIDKSLRLLLAFGGGAMIVGDVIEILQGKEMK